MLSAAHAGRGTPAVAAPVKTLVWKDDFNGVAGSAPSATNWTYDVGRGTSGWGNNELEYYVNPVTQPAWSHCCQLDGNSNLVITAYHETTPDSIVPATPNDTAYTSARLKTQGLQTFSPPCKVAARVYAPWTVGLWPAFWMVGDSTKATTGYTGWPAVGEIDVFEGGIGTFPGQQGNLHVGQIGLLSTNVSLNGYKGNYEYNPGPRWYTYGVDWYTDHINWHVDGQITGTVTQAQMTAANGDWTPLGPSGWPFFLLLNVAVGGTGGGTVTSAATFPQSVLIDWVGVWSI